jgi:hypothetical protein
MTMHDHIDYIVNKAIAAQCGANYKAKWKRQLKTKSGVTDIIEKQTTATIRIGVKYDNMASVQAKRQSGELPRQNQGLKGFTWILDGYTVRSVSTGKQYLRLTSDSFSHVPQVQFYRNGKPVSFESVKTDIYAKDYPKDERPVVQNVAISDILELNTD